jgi:endo-1,4-beta-xylanase
MRTNHLTIVPSLALIGVLLAAITSQGQPAQGANKFLGNITTMGQVRSDFLTYWNQITPENESKWSSVEGTRNTMRWTGVDNVKNFAEKNKISWKFHTLVWGGQCPSWINGLSQNDQLTEINQWFDLAAQKYPNVPMIDVVNEAHPNHAPAPYRNALGGNGTSGYDWTSAGDR